MLVTFVVPTIGRPTLARALDSLEEQTDTAWQAFICGDSISLEAVHRAGQRYARCMQSRRFVWTAILRGPRSAGGIRNRVLDELELAGPPRDDQWVAYLDDDDRLTPWYVEHLREHIEDFPWADIIIFRMKGEDFGVLPRPHGDLQLGHVGISFAVKASVMFKYRFITDIEIGVKHEDWDLLERMMRDGHRPYISPHIDYLVRDVK